MIKFRLPILTAGLLASICLAGAKTNQLYTETKTTIEKWAETESLVSKESNEWKAEKAILEDLVRMLEQEKEALDAKIAETKDSATESDKKRAGLLEQKDELDAAGNVVKSSLKEMESGIRELVPYLPTNYTDSITPILRQLPKADQETKLSFAVRLRNIVGILSQANKFDNTITLESETREFADGGSKQVNTLYFGFGLAYFADTAGENAGFGYPTAEGWKWEETPEHSEAVLDLLSMYQKGKQAEFVSLPVAIN